MDSCTNNSIRAHALTEAFKTEALSSCIELFEATGRELTDDAREFLMTTVEAWVDGFDIAKTYDVDCYALQIPDEETDSEEEVLFVKSEDMNEVFIDFKQRMTHMLLQLVMYDLELFLARKEIG